MNKKILVALSGGTSSAVAAALLKTQGYDVVAYHLRFWNDSDSSIKRDGGSCCKEIAIKNIETLCKRLGISLHIDNARDHYQNDILDYVIRENLYGRIPNPCALCNSRVKFHHFLKKADELKCELIATGHFAKSVRNPDGTETSLYRASDASEDQSYFLFDLKQEALARTLMPLGDLLKSNIQRMAYTFNIRTPEEDSATTEKSPICFSNKQDYCALIETQTTDRYRPHGPIVDQEGRILGRHKGIYHYKVGQSSGIEIDKTEYPDYSVIGFDPKISAVIVGPEKETQISSVVAINCNWIGLQDFSRGLKVKAKTSPEHEPIESTVTLLNNNSVLVDFHTPVRSPSPGQAIVFYQDDLVLGGGWIESTIPQITTKLRARQSGGGGGSA